MFKYELSITTQGPTYPPSEVMDADGRFIVIGNLNILNDQGDLIQKWGAAIVSQDSIVPSFGDNAPYHIVKMLDLNDLQEDGNKVLYTLPVPLPCNNYPMIFAPSQKKAIGKHHHSYPLHLAPIPDERPNDGRKVKEPITLAQWIAGKGQLTVALTNDGKAATFYFEFKSLIPNSLYTIMALRENDLNRNSPTRPGPLGIPNVFITNDEGNATYQATMPNPFEQRATKERNRIVNVVVLWMSTQMSYGGAIGHYGLGGDIHAQLKLSSPSFAEFNTHE